MPSIPPQTNSGHILNWTIQVSGLSVYASYLNLIAPTSNALFSTFREFPAVFESR